MAAPTIKSINDTLINQLQTKLNQSIPLLPRAFLRVLAQALAALYVTLYKYAGFMGLQQFVSRASFSPTVINGVEVTPLIEWGRLLRVADPAPAVQTQFTASVEVTTQGGTLASGTQYTNTRSGVVYVTLAPVALNASNVVISLRAVGDQSGGDGSGAIGNVADGTQIDMITPAAGVRRTATVLTTTTPGSDAESESSYRQRVVNRFQRVPQGGAYADYAEWAAKAPTTANAYPYTSPIPGVVDVYIESNTQPDGVPTGAELNAARDQIWQPDRRPANAYVRCLPITRAGFDVVVQGLDVTNPGQVQGQISDALAGYFKAREPYIEGLSVPPRRDRVSGASVIAEVAAIVNANGGIFITSTVTKGGQPVTVYNLDNGEKAKLDSLTFTT